MTITSIQAVNAALEAENRARRQAVERAARTVPCRRWACRALAGQPCRTTAGTATTAHSCRVVDSRPPAPRPAEPITTADAIARAARAQVLADRATTPSAVALCERAASYWTRVAALHA